MHRQDLLDRAMVLGLHGADVAGDHVARGEVRDVAGHETGGMAQNGPPPPPGRGLLASGT